MMKSAIFPGSFDPITQGHEAIARRALALFDKVYIAIGVNTDKKYMFTVEERKRKINEMFANEERVEVVTIVRGIRDAKDLEYEQTIAAVNHKLDPEIDTVLLLADMEHKDISSTLIREQMAHK